VIWGGWNGYFGMELERGVMESVLSWLDDLRLNEDTRDELDSNVKVATALSLNDSSLNMSSTVRNII
jgi:cell division inhibitor SulA